jgi:hypothetical protein
MLGLTYLIPDCWLEVSLHLEYPAPYSNVTLTLGWITLFMGDMGEGSTLRTKKAL